MHFRQVSCSFSLLLHASDANAAALHNHTRLRRSEGWVTLLFPGSFHLRPVSITLCLKLPTVAAGKRRQTLPASQCLCWMTGNSRPIVPRAAVFAYSPVHFFDSGSPWLPFWCTGRLCSEDLLLLRSHMRCPVTHFSSKGCCFSGRHAGVGSARCGSADAGKTIVVLFVVVCAPALPSHSLIFFCFVHLWLVEFGGCFTQVLD